MRTACIAGSIMITLGNRVSGIDPRAVTMWGPAWVRRCRLWCGQRFGDGGGAVSGVDQGVERGGDSPLLPQIEHALQLIEVIVIQYQQRLGVHPAANKHDECHGLR